MTKNQTRKSTQSSKPAPEPMDLSAVEVRKPHQATNHPRNAYALATLVNEVRDLFPEIDYETMGRDGRNVDLHVQFDTTGLDNDTAIDFIRLISLVDSDPRVEEVITDASSDVMVCFTSNPRTQDSREPFDLAAAWLTLMGEGSL